MSRTGFVLGLDGAALPAQGTFVVISRVIRMRLKAVDYSERVCCEMFRGILFGAGLLRGVSVDYSERGYRGV